MYFPTFLEEKKDLPKSIRWDFLLLWFETGQAILKNLLKDCLFPWLISMDLIFLTLVFFQVIQIW